MTILYNTDILKGVFRENATRKINIKNIWIRDFLPIKNCVGKYLSFQYEPFYDPQSAKGAIKQNHVAEFLNIDCQFSEISLDGGAVLVYDDIVLISNVVFNQNKSLSILEIKNELKRLFEAKEIHFLPPHPDDPTKHLDGIVRFIDRSKVLIQDYQSLSSKIEKYWYEMFYIYLSQYFEVKTIPFHYPQKQINKWDSRGCYLNFLKTEKHIYLPVFKYADYSKVVELLDRFYINHKLIPISCDEIAKEGGLINCITWEY